MYLGGVLAPSNQIVRSLLRTPCLAKPARTMIINNFEVLENVFLLLNQPSKLGVFHDKISPKAVSD